MVSPRVLGCSNISFSIKCLKPPFSADSTSQGTCIISFVSRLPSKSYMKKPSGLRSTTSPSLRGITSFVKGKRAGISEAMKFSFLPTPTTRGLPYLTATILSGSLEVMTAKA